MENTKSNGGVTTSGHTEDESEYYLDITDRVTLQVYKLICYYISYYCGLAYYKLSNITWMKTVKHRMIEYSRDTTKTI